MFSVVALAMLSTLPDAPDFRHRSRTVTRGAGCVGTFAPTAGCFGTVQASGCNGGGFSRSVTRSHSFGNRSVTVQRGFNNPVHNPPATAPQQMPCDGPNCPKLPASKPISFRDA